MCFPTFAARPSNDEGALLFLYGVIYAFPNARHAALQQEREVVEQENRAFCEKHGMPFGTREHTVCAEDLMDIRTNELHDKLKRPQGVGRNDWRA